MRIQQLDLLAFGPFSDYSIDLAAGNFGLHLVYGPNEAGKSSALRALRQLLYGIDDRTPDNFVHAYPKLRIGATLAHSDGTVLACIRRKGRKGTLRASDDKTILKDGQLQKFLGGVPGEVFQTMFGIDHDSLERGGKNMVEGEGEVGQVLFAAGAGVSDLREVMAALQQEADSLFRPTAQNPRINKSLSELKEARNTIRQAQLSRDEWARHDRELTEGLARKDVVEQELRELQRRKGRLERIRDALPSIASLRACEDELQHCRDAFILPGDFSEHRRELQERLRSAAHQQDESAHELAEIEAALAKLPESQALLEQATPIDDLYRRLGNHQKAMRDRPERQAEYNQLRAAAETMLGEIRPDLTLDEVERIRPTRTIRARVRDLGGAHQALLDRVEEARKSAAACRRRIADSQSRLEACPPALSAAELRQVLRRIQQYGDLESQRTAAQAELSRLEQDAAVQLERLPHWSGSLESLEKLAIPADETVDRFEQRLDDIRQNIQRIEDKFDANRRELEAQERQIEEFRATHAVPTEDDLVEARRHRDRGWQLVRRLAQGERPSDAETEEFLAGSGTTDVYDAYERSTVRADELADRLRREADRVAKLSSLMADRDRRRAQLPELERQRDAAEKQFQEADAEWAALWSPLEIAPLPPREMRAWIRKQHSLATLATDIRRQRETVERIDSQVKACREDLTGCLNRLGWTQPDHCASLRDLLDRAQAVADEIDMAKRNREDLERTLDEAQRELPDCESQQHDAEREWERWQTDWSQTMEQLDLAGTTSPAEANAFLEILTDLFQTLEKAKALDQRIEGINADAARFSADVCRLAEHVAADLADAPVEQAAAELNARLQSARTVHEQRQNLLKQRKHLESKLKTARAGAAEAQDHLKAMCREAGCNDPEELPQAEALSQRRQQLEARRTELQDQILHVSGGATLEEFVADAETVDPDTLEIELERFDERISELTNERDTLLNTIASEKKDLERMDGSARAAEAADAAEGILAQMAGDVEEYARLRLATALLQEGMERYRQKHQGPVLTRAGRLFSRLTLGSFADLQVDFDDGDRPILKGLRPNREIVGINGMSDGTADQLYLALRLASLEEYLDNHEPMPFIVDDVLVDFDNDRAVAALEALCELSTRTQVIFFTHHEHLVELAETNLDGDALFVHRLEPAAPPVNGNARDVAALSAKAGGKKQTRQGRL